MEYYLKKITITTLHILKEYSIVNQLYFDENKQTPYCSTKQ